MNSLQEDFLDLCSGEEVKGDENSFESRLNKAIQPFIEERANFLADNRLAQFEKELVESRHQYRILSEKYENLKKEMTRSREAFEKKRQQWQSIKLAVSQKDRLRTLFSSIEPVEEEVASESSDDLPAKIEPFPATVEPLVQENETDPLNLLIDELSATTSNQTTVQQSQLSIVDVPPQISDSKRASPKFNEVMRSKNARRQAHASDCPCCTKVIYF